MPHLLASLKATECGTGPFVRTNILKLNFASGRTGRMVVKLSLTITFSRICFLGKKKFDYHQNFFIILLNFPVIFLNFIKTSSIKKKYFLKITSKFSKNFLAVFPKFPKNFMKVLTLAFFTLQKIIRIFFLKC